MLNLTKDENYLSNTFDCATVKRDKDESIIVKPDAK